MTRKTRQNSRAEASAKAGRLDPGAIRPADLARLLTAASGRAVSADAIRAHLAAGAPANADGTINLVHYLAWLVGQVEQAGA